MCSRDGPSSRGTSRSLFKDRQYGEVLIGAETVLSAGGDEGGVTFPELQLLSVDFEHPASFEDDVDLVVFVYALMVWLWRDKRVDADVKSLRFVDRLVTTVGAAEARFGSGDIEGAGRIQCAALQWMA
jgi:hypothetical protein